MAVALESLQFQLSDGIAMPIRRNLAGSPVATPEWVAGGGGNPEDSPVFYRADLAAHNPVTIRVNLSASSPTEVFVRALDGSGANLLGDIPETRFAIGSNGYGIQCLTLPRARLSCVARHDDSLRWQYRLPDGEQWRDFAMTRHRIYVGLSAPTSPWTIDPSAGQPELPSADVLDWACQWAEGATSASDLGEFIARALYELGRSAKGPRPHYAETAHYSGGGDNYFFDCSKFLDFLSGSRSNSAVMNCSDCASVVSTFANILGSQFWQARLGPVLRTNPILPIGQSTTIKTEFTFHEVAWGGNAQASDPVWDGCLMIDGDSAPAEEPFTGIVATGVVFAGTLQYRDRLASAASAPLCIPKGMRVPQRNRPLRPGLAVPADPARTEELRSEYNFAEWAGQTSLPQDLSSGVFSSAGRSSRISPLSTPLWFRLWGWPMRPTSGCVRRAAPIPWCVSRLSLTHPVLPPTKVCSISSATSQCRPLASRRAILATWLSHLATGKPSFSPEATL